MSLEFWHQIKDNNKVGLQNLYEQFFEVLYAFGKYFHVNEAEVQDAIHNVFLRIWENRHNLNTPQNSKNYLMTALRNELNQNYRKASRIELKAEVTDVDLNMEEEESTFGEVRKEKVNKAIEELSTKNKEVIFLKYKENLSNEEIAEVLDINYQSVRNLLHRAIKQLRKKIAQSK